MYHPLRAFLVSGIVSMALGFIPYARYFILVLQNGEPVGGHLQSLLFGALFIIMGVMFMVIGLVADLLAINRKLLEDMLYRVKKIEYYQDDHNEKLTNNKKEYRK
jgi:hypothetical protein